MFLTIASYKGGVGKTTTAIHLAAFLQQRAPTILIDGDPNRSASGYARRGRVPFVVIDERGAAREARKYEHVVIDTAARPDEEDLKLLATNCDVLVIPTTPDAMALEALEFTVKALVKFDVHNFRIVLTDVPPRPSRDGEEVRLALVEKGLPIFRGEIRRRAAFKKASLAGVPVYEVSDQRAAEAWADYEAIGKEILDGK